jgi:hypothetical protein
MAPTNPHLYNNALQSQGHLGHELRPAGEPGHHAGAPIAGLDMGKRQSTEKISWHRVISFDPRVIARAQGLEKNDIVAARRYLKQRMYKKGGKCLFISELVEGARSHSR